MTNYTYPIELDWSQTDMIKVIHFLNQVEQAYESKVSVEIFLRAYQEFKEVVPSIGQEKQIGRDFEKESGYSLYQALQEARQTSKEYFTMKE